MERSLPADIHAERAVLGSCLIEREAILAARNVVAVADFYLEKHAWVYEAMLACLAQRTPPDLTTVAGELRRRERLDLVGGMAFLGELSAEVPTAVHVEYYARTVARCAAHRRLIELGGRISAAGYDEQRDLDDLYREIKDRLDLEKRVSGAAEQWRSTYADGQTIWNSHFEFAPFVIEELLPPGTMLMTGKAKTNKTFLNMNFAYAVAGGGRALGQFPAVRGECLYIDLEMGADIIHERLKAIYPHEPPPVGVKFVHQWPHIGDGFEDWLTNYLEERPYTRLVVLDTFSAVCPDPPRGLTQYLYEKRLMQRLTDHCHQYPHMALIVVHHSRKMLSGDPIDDASGSTGLSGGVDNFASLTRDPTDAQRRILTVLGRRIKRDGKIDLKWDYQLAQWSIAGTKPLSKERQAALDLLGERPGLSAREIAVILNREEPGTRRLLSDMRKEGAIENVHGVYFRREDVQTGDDS